MKNTVWFALSDKTRRKIISLLKIKDLSAGEISDNFSLSKPTISHHLAILKESGIVDSKKEKNNIIYSLNDKIVYELISAFTFMGLKRSV